MLLTPVKTLADSPIVSEPPISETKASQSILPQPAALESQAPVSQTPESKASQSLVTPSNNLKRGIENLKDENLEEALEGFKAARDEAPDSSVAAYFLGITYKKMMDFEAARNMRPSSQAASP